MKQEITQEQKDRIKDLAGKIQCHYDPKRFAVYGFITTCIRKLETTPEILEDTLQALLKHKPDVSFIRQYGFKVRRNLYDQAGIKDYLDEHNELKKLSKERAPKLLKSIFKELSF